MEMTAQRIRARAIRRCGELLKEIEKGKTGPKQLSATVDTQQATRQQAATEAGLSKDQAKTAIRVANVPEETLWSIATDCNSMRRDMTSSLRACLAAESWKRLYPDGAPGKGKRTDLQPKSKNGLTFEEFARDSFKVSPAYAKQALAILNHSPELLEDAKHDLAGNYKIYQSRVAEDSAAAAAELNVGTSSLDRARRLQRDGIPELQDMVNTGEIKVTTAAEVSKLPEHNQQNLSVEYLPIA